MSKKIVGVLLLSVGSACVSVPTSKHEDANLSADAAWPDELALDAGAQRPATGEPYRGPECDPASSTAGGDPHASHADGGGVSDAASANGEMPAKAMQPGPDASNASSHVDPTQLRHPKPGEIVITEIMSNPAAVADTAGEWFELHNPSASQALDLGGCSVEDGAAKPHALPAPFVIDKREFVVVGRGAEAGFAPDLMLSFSLGNTADTLVLRCDGREIDRVAYGEGFPLAAGASMALDPAASADDNDAAGAWCLGQADYGGDRGTPGSANPACDSAETDAGVE
jgi:hypothetical protein